MQVDRFPSWSRPAVMRRSLGTLVVLGWIAGVSHAAQPESAKPQVPSGAQFVTIPGDKDGGPPLPAFWFAASSQAGADVGAGPGKATAARPAVVLLHGCSGAFYRSGRLNARFLTMANRLVAQGYGVLVPDSFSPRGHQSICNIPLKERPIGMTERVRDAYLALDYLARRKDVQASNIGMIGFSHGAMTVLNSNDSKFPDVDPGALTSARYNGAVAFYPGCVDVVRRKPAFSARTPLLILIGEKDDWTFPEHCQRLANRAAQAGQPVSIVTYPSAYHAFDMAEPARLRTDVKRARNPDGVHVGGDPVARDDAYRRVDAFFRERFGAKP